MGIRTVKEGNAFYEIDEECLKKREEKKQQTHALKKETGNKTKKEADRDG